MILKSRLLPHSDTQAPIRRTVFRWHWLMQMPISYDACPTPPPFLPPNPLLPTANFLLQVTLSCRIGVREKKRRRERREQKRWKKSGESCRKLCRACVRVCWWCLASALCLRCGPPLLLRLPDGYEQLCGLLSDNCSLLIYNVKLNDSLSPASSPLLEADSALMQAAMPAPIGRGKCQSGCRMLHPHDLKYKSILGRLTVSYVCSGVHAHPDTHNLSLHSHCSHSQIHCLCD